MSERTLQRARAAVVAIAPIVLLVGFFWLPYVSNFTDEATVAAKAAGDPTRWMWGGILIALGAGFAFAALVAIRVYLAGLGEQRWSPIAVLLVLVGGTLFIGTDPSVGVGYAAAAGLDPTPLAASGNDWVLLRLVASIVFGLGWLSLALAVYQSRALTVEATWLVVGALVVLTVMLFVPVGWGLYVLGLAALVADWVLAYRMWGRELMGRPMGASRPMGV